MAVLSGGGGVIFYSWDLPVRTISVGFTFYFLVPFVFALRVPVIRIISVITFLSSATRKRKKLSLSM